MKNRTCPRCLKPTQEIHTCTPTPLVMALESDIARHIAICAEQAQEIERLREWIRDEGLRSYTCTYNILKELCGNCECRRKPKAALAAKGKV